MSDAKAHVISAPLSSASDTVLTVVSVRVAGGAAVRIGELILEVEGAKSVVEVVSEAAGTLYLLVEEGQSVKVGEPLAVIAEGGLGRDAAIAVAAAGQRAEAAEDSPRLEGVIGARFTKSAEALIRRHELSPQLFANLGLVTGAMVELRIAALAGQAAPWQPRSPKRGHNGRVAVIGGGAGAAQLLSVLLFEEGTRVVCLLDDDKNKLGSQVKGVSVIGGIGLLEKLWRDREIDTVVTSASVMSFRAAMLQLARRVGVPMANVIHQTAAFDDGVTIGQGNFFGAFCYVGADTVIGDNGFFSSRTTFEHHNRIGSTVTTGPTVATSGLVTIGDEVKFGAGVVVEPRLTIGSRAVVSSHATVTSDVAEGSTVKMRKTLKC